MNKVFLVQNSYGQSIKACSTLKKAFEFAKENRFRYDYAELTGVTELDIDGETWGTHHSFDEMEEED